LFYDQRGGGRSRTGAQDIVTWRTQVTDLGAVIRSSGSPCRPSLATPGRAAGDALCDGDPHGPGTAAPGRLALIDPAAVTREYRAAFEIAFKRRSETDAVRSARAELAASGLRESEPDAYRQRAFELSVAATSPTGGSQRPHPVSRRRANSAVRLGKPR